VAVVGLLALRTAAKLNVPGAPDDTHWAMRDFRDAVYGPVVAFLAGVNPYAPAEYLAFFPAGNTFPLYAPHTLLLHLPFALLPLVPAEALYFLVTVALVVVIAIQTLGACRLAATPARVLALATAVLLSRPGHWNLLLGQYAVTMTVGAYLALVNGDRRPGWAGAGLALTAMKPTFGVPLAILLLARGDRWTVAIGVALAGVLSTIALAHLAYATGDLAAVLASIPANYAAFAADPNVDPLTTPYRPDVAALIAPLTGWRPGPLGGLAIAAVVLGTAALAVRRARSKGGAARHASTTIICLGVVSSVYHQSYDLVLLTLPLTAVAAGRWPTSGTPRWAIAALLACPMANYLASGSVLEALRLPDGLRAAVGAINAAALLAAFALAIGAVRSRMPAAHEARPAHARAVVNGL
jgi:hypothetical protein